MKAATRKAWERANLLMDSWDVIHRCWTTGQWQQCPDTWDTHENVRHREAASLALDGIDHRELP